MQTQTSLIHFVAIQIGSVRKARHLIEGGKVQVGGEVVTDTFHQLLLAADVSVSITLEVPNPVKFLQVSFGVDYKGA